MAEGTGRRRLAWHNRRVLAERLNWPDGHLATCERLDGEHPGWYTDWTPGDRQWTATHEVRSLSYRFVRARTVEDLVAKMAEADALAAAQLAEWELLNPRGWSVIASQ